MNTDALKDLLLRMADDALIIGHRHSEWTGLGPVLEEDIAFSSIAQDKIGHSLALFQLLEALGAPDPDTYAFTRDEKEYRCCHFVELPNGEYDFSLVRHFLFDTAEYVRYNMLSTSSYEPLAKLAKKIHGEIKYHVYHGKTWFVQLSSQGTDESRARMQSALNEAMPYALGIFEAGVNEDALASDGVFAGEESLRERWLQLVTETVTAAGLNMPDVSSMTPVLGGRKGYHTEHLQPLLTEMTEVFRVDPKAEW